MSASVRWSGLDELRAQLRALPADLTAEASHIVQAAANAAEVEIKAAYPVRTGRLRDHVIQTHFEGGKFSTGVVLKNTSPLAWIYENGTQARHSAIGAFRGSMPPGHVFIPRVIRARGWMYAQLSDLLVRHGLRVSGDANAFAA